VKKQGGFFGAMYPENSPWLSFRAGIIRQIDEAILTFSAVPIDILRKNRQMPPLYF
jgi:hypothetical protein